MVGAQAWQLSLPCCPASCFERALQSSSSPGILPLGRVLGSGLWSQLLPVSPSTCPPSPAQVWSTFVGEDAGPACHAEIHMPFLGQLLGHLILCRTRKSWEISWVALDALHHLFRFILQQKCTTLPEDNAEHPQRQREREAAITSWLSLPSTSNITTAFGKYLQPSERTDIVLVAIEAMRDSSTYDKEEASSILDMAMREPACWLTEVSGLWLPCP
ncbi:uncharacterized protein [Haliaeetus albicilla]|uniref:uncharacterized protein n=1 Tax=Haliaeetus albicilla TaxID=8969 RepID=UPI0037E8D4D8